MTQIHRALAYSTMAILLACGISTPSASAGDHPGWPKFSWDRVPVCLHFGITGRTMNSEELKFVADTSNFICLEKAHGMKTLGSTEKGIAHDAKRIKELNPDAKVLFYWNGILNFSFYDVYEETRNNRNLVLRDKQGKPLLKGGKTGVEQFNIVDVNARKWWAAQAGRAVRDYHCDGVFMDALPQVETRIPKQIGGGPKSKQQAISAAIDVMQRAKSEMGPDKILLFNGLRNLDRGNATYGKPFLEHADGAMFEHFTCFASRTKESILKDIDWIVSAGKQGKLLVVKGWPEQDFNWMNKEKMRLPQEKLAEEAKEKITFSLACFLVAAQEHSYFCYSWGYRERGGTFVDYPEFKKPLGAPKGDYRKNGWTLTREFEHASVRVDLGKRKAKIDWR
ncbi:putative glycoside hydrolase [Haloferula sp.]|uniref:putative glycoside hydrolase n=1 Tax=Haloferula sp. TaxID=2497595 RepID=UPI003C78B6E1